MRFGKRNKQSLAMGWRVRTQPEDSDFSPVASEERDALLSPAEPEGEAFPMSDEPPTTGTQRLLTALGRFERQVAKAREGAPQEVWSDECMNQLINAVEVALSEGWEEVVEALTETGRILQSYENVNQAHQAIPFLSDSYEALCLMVGDLIVGKVRSGVILKWRNRYRLALEDLRDAGIPLVRDDEDSGRRGRTAPTDHAFLAFPASRVQRDAGDGMEDDCPADEAARDAEAVAAPEGITPTDPVFEPAPPRAGRTVQPSPLTELQPLTPLRMDLFDMDAAGEEARATGEDEGGTAPEVIERLDVLCEQLSHMERHPQADPLAAFCTILDSVGFLEGHASAHGRPGRVALCDMMARMCDLASELPSGPDDKFFELAYAFCGVYVEADDSAENPMIRSWIEECEGLLAGWREALESGAAAEEFVVGEPILEAEEEEPPSIEVYDTPVEPEPVVAAAAEEEVEALEAGRVYAAADPAVDEAELFYEVETAPGQEAEAQAMDAMEPETNREEADVTRVPAASPVLEAVQDDAVEAEEAVQPDPDGAEADSPEALLQVAQRAMTGGRAAEAKRLALRAAAMLAQFEVEEAVKRVAEAEKRLRQGADLIEQARAEVQRAEHKVLEASTSVAEGETSLGERQRHSGEVSQRLGEVEGRVADLDEQIRQLQLRRDEEAKRLEETRGSLEEARQAERSVEADLELRRKAEEEARVRLEDSRQRVKTLQRKRTEVEAGMERARETLGRQRASLADIQETLAQVGERAQEPDAPDTDEFLF